MLGPKDMRVLMQDAKQYLAAFRAREGAPETRVIVFPKETYALDKPQTEFEHFLQSIECCLVDQAFHTTALSESIHSALGTQCTVCAALGAVYTEPILSHSLLCAHTKGFKMCKKSILQMLLCNVQYMGRIGSS